MTFNDWLQEIECFSMREERLQCAFSHLDKLDWKELMEWLEAAYDVGYDNGQQEILDKGVPF